MRLLHLLPLLLATCTPLRAPSSAAEEARDTVVPLHVDPAAAAGGDGSVHRPVRRLEEALGRAGARTVRLAPGRYQGPFHLPAGLTLEGPAAAILMGDRSAPLLTAEGALTLRGVTLQGGTVAVAGPGPLTLEGVALSDQGQACLAPGAGLLHARGVRFGTGAALAHCLLLGAEARAALADVTFQGPYGRAIEVRGAHLTVTAGRFQGAGTALHQRGGTVRLQEVEVGGGAGPGLFAAGGALTLVGVRLQGHEYGLHTGGEARVEAQRLEVRGASRAGVALVRSRARLEQVRVGDCGSFGAVQLVSSEVTLHDLDVAGAEAVGVSVVGGRVTLVRGAVRGVRSDVDGAEGEGLSLRRARVTLRDVSVRDVAGVGVVSAEGAEVSGEALRIEGAGVAGAAAETEGRLEVDRLVVRGTRGPAVVVTTRGRVHVGTLVSEANAQGAVGAACSEGGQVRVREVRGESRAGLDAPCVAVGSTVGKPGAPR